MDGTYFIGLGIAAAGYFIGAGLEQLGIYIQMMGQDFRHFWEKK